MNSYSNNIKVNFNNSNSRELIAQESVIMKILKFLVTENVLKRPYLFMSCWNDKIREINAHYVIEYLNALLTLSHNCLSLKKNVILVQRG